VTARKPRRHACFECLPSRFQVPDLPMRPNSGLFQRVVLAMPVAGFRDLSAM
jgi:hypothetical protein